MPPSSVPDRPTTGITPYVIIPEGRAAGALEFYCHAFGGEIIESTPADDGRRLLHRSLRLNNGWLMGTDAFPEWGHDHRPPECTTLHLQVNDAGMCFNRAIEAGCTTKRPVADQFWGDRYRQVIDPFGHERGIATKV